MKRRLFVIMALLLAVVAGCSGGGGGSKTKAPTADTFDRNLLTAVVLQASDVPPGLQGNGSFGAPGAPVLAFNKVFKGTGLRITSSVARYGDQAKLDQDINHLRRAFGALVGEESAYDINGSDAAYVYRSESPAALAAIILRAQYALTIQVQATAPAQSAAALDIAAFNRYAETTLQRLQQLIDNPSSITPVAEAAGSPPPESTAAPTP